MACAVMARMHPDFEDDSKRLISSYQTESGTIHIRLIINNLEGLPGTHVHIETARESAFEEPPEANASLEEVFHELSKIEAHDISVRGCAKFEMPADLLSQHTVISLLRQVTTGPADANVRLTGSTFEIEGGPVKTLEWKVCEEYDGEESIRTEIDSETQLHWHDGYIIECLQPAIEAFRTFVLEEPVESEVDHV